MGRRLLFAALGLTLATVVPSTARADMYTTTRRRPRAERRRCRSSRDARPTARCWSAITARQLDGLGLAGRNPAGPGRRRLRQLDPGVRPRAGQRGVDAGRSNGTWGPWVSLGGYATSRPRCRCGAARSTTSTWPCAAADNALWHRAFIPGSGWRGWLRLRIGGVLTSGPPLDLQSPEMLNIFVRAVDGSVAQRPWNGATWLDWIGLGGGIYGAPAAVSRAENDLDLYARGDGNRIYQNHWDARGWTGWSLTGGDGTAVGSAPGPRSATARTARCCSPAAAIRSCTRSGTPRAAGIRGNP